MTFWNSELGELSGKAEDAFTKIFIIIPNDTKAIAKIAKFTLHANVYVIEWILIDGEYKNNHVFQKIKAFDADPKKRHRALNMMKYLYNLFQLSPSGHEAPIDEDLLIFVGKHAGIVIKEWSAPKQDGPGFIEGNYVSEIHSATNFKSEIGIKSKISSVETAFSRNETNNRTLDDIPF